MSDELKRASAMAALEEVRSGMRLGIGTGSTAEFFVRALAEKVAGGLDIIGVPTSERTAALARELGVPLTTLDETPELDLTVDGADELDARLQLIKGGGAALLREKIVAAASRRMVVIADDSKLVETLGRFPLPIEVMPFGLEATRRAVVKVADALSLKGEVVLRMAADGSPLVTDGGHYILDAHWGRLPDASGLADRLAAIPGVVEHGLFIGLAKAAYVAGPSGVRQIAVATADETN
ncbi:ribose-5-phosphate isomerase [Breoghania corrubedonensis]|uniref:Ribose-5-phosphate isomerase A n=1 Tax=Breoghania corrubedonensis TaxID=665038 RepID=A0A2T5VAY8_9HYPH|nr:ribose-5-phosphate isomerase RpiA [Breoghania corrubedonensis]PTW60911.1 ribose-5-phosphate isomerase [Breoghania corrubedonensis]